MTKRKAAPHVWVVERWYTSCWRVYYVTQNWSRRKARAFATEQYRVSGRNYRVIKYIRRIG